MTRPLFVMSFRREFSLRTRFFLALLALLQFIAPTWHVCEMGGSVCCPPQTSAAKLQCHLPSEAGSTPGPALCDQCPPKVEASAPQVFVGAVPAPHEENCLAKLLLGMPWQSVSADGDVSLRAIEVGSTPQAPHLISVADLPQPPSRGPPTSFL